MISHERFLQGPCAGIFTLLLGACSADGVDDLAAFTDLEGTSESSDSEALYVPSLDEREAEFQRQVNGVVTDEEMADVESLLADSGIDLEQVAFAGRTVMIDDVYVDVDGLLLRQNVSKGRVLAEAYPDPLGPEGIPVAPEVFAKLRGPTEIEFFRPMLTQRIIIVVPDSPTFLLTTFNNVASAVNATASDCFSTGATPTIRALKRSSYNALSTQERDSTPAVQVTWAARNTSCPGSPASLKGCSGGPRHGNVRVGASTQHRMLIGPRIGLVSTLVQDGSLANQSIALHEFLHTLGLGHIVRNLSTEHPLESIVVVGTSSSQRIESVMQNNCLNNEDCTLPALTRAPCCFRSIGLSNDDTDVIDTLYSPLPSTGCSYVEGFQVVQAN